MRAAPTAHPRHPPSPPPCSPHPCCLSSHPCSPSPPQTPPERASSPCPQILPAGDEGRDPEPYPVPGGRCSGVCTVGDTLLASEPTKPLSVSGDTMRCSCRCTGESRIGAGHPQDPPAGSRGAERWAPTLQGWCWVAALTTPLLRRDQGARCGGKPPSGGLALAGGSAALAGDRWPRVLPCHGGSPGVSGVALFSRGCLWGEDGA